MSIQDEAFPTDKNQEVLKTDIDDALDAQLAEAARLVEVQKFENYEVTRREKRGLPPIPAGKRKDLDDKLVPRKDLKSAIGKTRKIILMMVYDELTLAEISPILNIGIYTLQLVASSPLFRAQLKKEVLAKQKLYREGAMSELANKVLVKYNQILENGELIFEQEDGTIKKVRVNGKDVIDMGKTILEMAGHGQKNGEQIVKHDHSSLSDAIVKAHEELEKGEGIDGEGADEVIDVEALESVEMQERRELEKSLSEEDKERLDWEDEKSDPLSDVKEAINVIERTD